MSIAAQLRVLASAERKSDAPVRSRPSFLFDSRVASDTDSQTIYNLSRNGLTELIKLNQTFLAFEQTLFARVPEPSFMGSLTPETRKKLDASVQCFLKLLSPYFLQRSAHKCIEFLIRCYSVQEHNVEAVLGCILPYHETALFARLLAILNLDRSPRFAFLRASQKHNAPLARATLVRRCLTDPALLAFIVEFGRPSNPAAALAPYLSALGVTAVPPSPKHAVALYTLTVVDVLASAERVTDDLVTALLPTLLGGLAAAAHPEHQTAAYMVLTQLCARTHLRPRVLAEVLAQLCAAAPRDATPHGLQPVLLCLLAILNSQRAVLLSAADGAAAPAAASTTAAAAAAAASASASAVPVSGPCAELLALLRRDVVALPAEAVAALARVEALPEALAVAADAYDVSALAGPLAVALAHTAFAVPSASAAASAASASGSAEQQRDTTEACARLLLRLVERTDLSPLVSHLVPSIVLALAPAMAAHLAGPPPTPSAATARSVSGASGKRAAAVTAPSSATASPTSTSARWPAWLAGSARTVLLALDARSPAAVDVALRAVVLAAHDPHAARASLFAATQAAVDVAPSSVSPSGAAGGVSAPVLGVLMALFRGTRHEALPRAGTTLLLALGHDDVAVRLDAVARIGGLIDAALPAGAPAAQRRQVGPTAAPASAASQSPGPILTGS